MGGFTEIPLPGSFRMDLPFKKQLEKGEIQKTIRVKVKGYTVLSRFGDIGDLELSKAFLDCRLERIIKDIAESMATIASLRSFFNSGGAIPIPDYPGVYLKKDTVELEELKLGF